MSGLHFYEPETCRVCGRQNDAGSGCLCLDEPPAGTRCEVCGCEKRIWDFCPDCHEAEMQERRAALHGDAA